MSEKKQITSWRGQYVRLKREFFEIKEEFDGDWDDDMNWVIDESMPKVTYTEINCPLHGWIGDPTTEVFYVFSDIYGVDLYGRVYNPFVVGSIEPTHQLIIRGHQMDSYPFPWDSKYFEVVKEERVTTSTWILDTEFYNRPDCINQ